MLVASLGAGAIHLTAASAHSEHAPILAFFIGAGIIQIVWAAAIVSPRPPSLLLRLGALGNAGLIAVWLASRLSGLPFVDGADHAEPVGVKDTSAVALELLIVIGALALVAGGRSLSLRIRVTERAFVPIAAATALLIIPGLARPAHEHSDSHMHGGDAHEHTELAAAAGHGHDDAGVEHGHKTEVAGHAHEAVSPAGETMHTHDGAAHVSTATHATPASPIAAPKVQGLRASARYGPYILGPADFGGEAHYNRIKMNVRKPCTNCYIVSMAPNMVYADGSPANLKTGTMLHHAVWTRPDIDDRTCGRDSTIGFMGERFFASGNERTEMSLPEGFGYFVGTDRWGLIAELMNHSQQSRTVYLTLDVVYRPASDKLRKVTPVWMDIDNCGDSQYAVPKGQSKQLWTWTSSITGRVLTTGGHVHNGGVKTILTNESTKQQMCTSVAGYGTKSEYMNTIESMSTCVWDRIGVVRKGEKLGIWAYYNSSAAQTDVMGINIAFIYETNDLSGGSAYKQARQAEAQPPSSHHDHP